MTLWEERISVSGPSITNKEIEYVTEAVTNAWYQNANMFHERFEKAFAEYLGTRFAISLPSCTAAIHLSLSALGIGIGDEVIVPEITWIASAAPIHYVGATPIFADIDEATWCISPESIEKLITKKTKAIIIVDLYGGMPNMDIILQIAKKYNLAVIEDAAEAIGSEYKGKKAGSFGDTGVFSFHGSKTMTTGEGGMLVTDSEELFRKCLILRDHGRKPTDPMFFNDQIAFKYKMSSMQAALGLAQLERIEELVEHKRRVYDWYKAKLIGIKGITLNNEPVHTKNTYWMVTILLSPELGWTKEYLMEQLLHQNIDSRPFFYPLSSLPAYQEHKSTFDYKIENVVSYKISPYGLNLPCGMNITEEIVDYICLKIKDIIAFSKDEI